MTRKTINKAIYSTTENNIIQLCSVRMYTVQHGSTPVAMMINCACQLIPLPGAGRRPEGANIDRRLVPYDAKCMRIQSRIEFIYIFICINGLLMRGIGKFGPGKYSTRETDW